MASKSSLGGIILMRAHFGSILLFATAALVPMSCLSIDPADGAYQCAPTGQACPTGYQCAADGFCRRNVNAGAPSQTNSEIQITPSMKVPADDATTAAIVISVQDANGNPVPNQAVHLDATGQGNTIVQPSATAEDGTTSGTIRSSVAEHKTITAVVGSFTLNADIAFSAGPATSLRFTQPPSNAAPGQILTPPIKVTQFDAKGNVADSTVNVITVALHSGGTLSGTTQSATALGSAVFSDLSIATQGTYTMDASAGALSVTSGPFSIAQGTPAPPTNVMATVVNGNVVLTWTASTAATSYNVRRSLVSGSGYSSIAMPTGTMYTDPAPAPATYYYVIDAINGNAVPVPLESGPSLEVSATVGQILCVSNSGNNSTTSYLASANGAVAPLPNGSLLGSNTALSSPVALAADTVHNEIAVANFASGTVTVFTLTESGNMAPARTLSGVSKAFAVAIDATTNDELYVGTYNGTSSVVTVYPRVADGASGTVNAPIKRTLNSTTVTGLTDFSLNGIEAILVDAANNEIFVANADGGTVSIYPRTAAGSAQPTVFLHAVTPSLNGPDGLAYDVGRKELYVANVNNVIMAFNRTMLTGPVSTTAPVRTIAGAPTTTGLSSPAGLAFSSVTDELFVANNGTAASIIVFPRTATGATTPTRTISGGGTGLSGAWGVAICK